MAGAVKYIVIMRETSFGGEDRYETDTAKVVKHTSDSVVKKYTHCYEMGIA